MKKKIAFCFLLSFFSVFLVSFASAQTEIWNSTTQTGSGADGPTQIGVASLRDLFKAAYITNGQWNNIRVCFVTSDTGTGENLTAVNICERDGTTDDCVVGTQSFFPDFILPDANTVYCQSLTDTTYEINGSLDYAFSFYAATTTGRCQYWASAAVEQYTNVSNNVSANAIWYGSRSDSFMEVANMSGSTPAAGNVGCNVTNIVPANATTQTSSSWVNFSGNLTCYQDTADNCTLYLNGTSVSTNTTIANNSLFQLNSSTGNGVWYWSYNCSNGTYSNSSAAWNLTVAALCTPVCNGSAIAEWVWNFTGGRSANASNLTGVVACTNASNVTENSIWTHPDRNLTSFGTLVADIVTAIQASTLVDDIVAAVWTYASRTLTAVNWNVFTGWNIQQGFAWNATDRNLTYYNCSGGSGTSNLTAFDVWNATDRNLTYYNCTTTGNLTANCTVDVDGCTRPIVLKTGDCK